MLANMGVIRLLKTTPVEGVAPADFDEDVTRLRSEHYAKPDMYARCRCLCVLRGCTVMHTCWHVGMSQCCVSCSACRRISLL